MNEHLKPVFETVLPKINSGDIMYWVYGGLGYASIVGKFYRSNPDVDLFVLDSDFDNLEKILANLCKENKWETHKTFNGRERLSVIPVYKTDEYVEFKFSEGTKKYSLDILAQVERHLEGYGFTTPQDDFLKTLLVDYLLSKNKYPKKRLKDAEHILTKEEIQKYFHN